MEHLERLIQSTAELYKACVRDLSHELNNNKQLASVTQKGGTILLGGQEEVQIQITITRNEANFLDDFETVASDFYNPTH